jgi:hypothetical protein
MTFKEKIDKILQVNKLGINSVSALEDKVEAGRGAINEFYNENREPGRKTLKKIKSLKGLNEVWYDTGKGEVFMENGTYVDTASDNKEITMTAKETFWREVMEDTDHPYRVVPSSVFKDYKIVPDKIIDVIIRSNESEKIALNEKYELIIQGLENQNKRLEKEKGDLQTEIENLRRQIPAKL